MTAMVQFAASCGHAVEMTAIEEFLPHDTVAWPAQGLGSYTNWYHAKNERSLNLCQHSYTIPEYFLEHWWNTYSTFETGCHSGIVGNGICRGHLGIGKFGNKHVNNADIWVRIRAPDHAR